MGGFFVNGTKNVYKKQSGPVSRDGLLLLFTRNKPGKERYECGLGESIVMKFVNLLISSYFRISLFL